MNLPEDRALALSRFQEGPLLLERTVMGLKDCELDFTPSGGGWSIRQIVHHVVDGDDIWKLGIKMSIGNDQAEFSLEWYSLQTQEAWADRWAYGQRSLAPSIVLLKAIREHVVQLLATAPEGWDRAVVLHTPQGESERVSVGFVIQMQTEHLLHHVERIRAILQECVSVRQTRRRAPR
jgi:hypothetical protein